MKPESRASFLNRSFRRSFKKKKNTEKATSSENQIEEEEKAFTEFKNVVCDFVPPRYDEIPLRRFFRARKSNIDDATKLLKLDMAMRKLLQIEDVTKIPIPEVAKYVLKSAVIGINKDGCIIRIIKIGKIDLKGLVHSLSTIQLLLLCIRVVETDIKDMQEESKKTGKGTTQIIFIIDFDGITTSQILYKPVLDTLMLCIKRIQDHYFEYWKKIYAINAPSYFPSIYKLIKPVMIEELSSKVVICGTDYSQLLDDIDSEVLPEFLGGSKKEPIDHPKYANLLTEYSPIPHSLYAGAEDFLNPNEPGVESLTVSAGGFVNVPIPVIVANSIIDYRIYGKDNDIGITVYYEPNVTVCHVEKYKKKINPKEILSKLEQLTPEVRTQCHVHPENGRVIAWRPGVYTLNFDNTYSWMNSKQIYYKVQVIPPGAAQYMPDVITKTRDLQLNQ